jgi:3-hydroxyisobutyrate dehydrogenase-like beta-hydroxyacid dehydrogenase
MAGHVLRAGHDLVVWNRTPQRAADLVTAGARQATTPAQAAANRDVVVLMLASGEYTPPAFTLDLLGKDLDLALGAGHRPLPVTAAVTAAVAAAVRVAVAAGPGGADMAALASDRAAPDA